MTSPVLGLSGGTEPSLWLELLLTSPDQDGSWSCKRELFLLSLCPPVGSQRGQRPVTVHPAECLHSAHRSGDTSSPFLLLSSLRWGSGCGCPGHFTVVLGLKSVCMWFCFSGVPVSSRVSAKIQQLVNTLKRPKRPPLREFFVDDFEELLEGKRTLSYPRLSQLPCDPINCNDIFSTKAIFLSNNKTGILSRYHSSL